MIAIIQPNIVFCRSGVFSGASFLIISALYSQCLIYGLSSFFGDKHYLIHIMVSKIAISSTKKAAMDNHCCFLLFCFSTFRQSCQYCLGPFSGVVIFLSSFPTTSYMTLHPSQGLQSMWYVSTFFFEMSMSVMPYAKNATVLFPPRSC